jgi:hypothetical protein
MVLYVLHNKLLCVLVLLEVCVLLLLYLPLLCLNLGQQLPALAHHHIQVLTCLLLPRLALLLQRLNVALALIDGQLGHVVNCLQVACQGVPEVRQALQPVRHTLGADRVPAGQSSGKEQHGMCMSAVVAFHATSLDNGQADCCTVAQSSPLHASSVAH